MLCLKLGAVLKHCAMNYSLNQRLLIYGENFIVFCVFWLSWIHMTFYLNRFYTEDVVHKLFFLVYNIGVVCMIINTNKTLNDDNKMEYADCMVKSAFTSGFLGSFILTRTVISVLYSSIMVALPATRKQFALQLLCWVVNIVIAIVMISTNKTRSKDVFIVTVFAITVIEWLGIIISTAKGRSIVKFNVDHLNSRFGSFIMIMLGEW